MTNVQKPSTPSTPNDKPATTPGQTPSTPSTPANQPSR